jgi:hypothetical protein
MTKEELFKKYSIKESHSEWNSTIDNWMSVEIYRLMHNGELPPQDGSDTSTNWILEFIDKTKDITFVKPLMEKGDFGSLYLTAHRMVYRYADQIVEN